MDMQRSETRKTERSAWPYLISGVAIGAALGVLFAPEKGEETRRKAGEWLKEKRAQGRRWMAARRHGRPVGHETRERELTEA